MENIHVVLFKSRNKDNKHLKDFKERTELYWSNERNLNDKFINFVSNGLQGEVCRFYESVNSRNLLKAKKILTIRLVDNDDFDITNIKNLSISYSMLPQCSLDKKWLIDFDSEDENLFNKLIDFLKPIVKIEQHIKTLHGHHIVVEHGFDTRDLYEEFSHEEVTIHRDGYILLDTKIKQYIGATNLIFAHRDLECITDIKYKR